MKTHRKCYGENFRFLSEIKKCNGRIWINISKFFSTKYPKSELCELEMVMTCLSLYHPLFVSMWINISLSKGIVQFKGKD